MLLTQIQSRYYALRSEICPPEMPLLEDRSLFVPVINWTLPGTVYTHDIAGSAATGVEAGVIEGEVHFVKRVG